MDDRLTERLHDAVAVIAKAAADFGESIKQAADAMVESLVRVASEQEDAKNESYEALMRALNEFNNRIDNGALQELFNSAEDLPPITKKKIPRPPKSIGPVNKANYTANRPPRNARSSCRIIKRR